MGPLGLRLPTSIALVSVPWRGFGGAWGCDYPAAWLGYWCLRGAITHLGGSGIGGLEQANGGLEAAITLPEGSGFAAAGRDRGRIQDCLRSAGLAGCGA